jgi:hypothetical protein
MVRVMVHQKKLLFNLFNNSHGINLFGHVRLLTWECQGVNGSTYVCATTAG